MFAQDALPIVSVVAAVALIGVLASRAPRGLPLQPSEAPLLFKFAEGAAARVGTRIDKLFLTNEFNCDVVAIPTFVAEQNILYIGFPVLLCMSVAQLELILDHEAIQLVAKADPARRVADHQRQAWFALMQNWRQKYLYL
jgi:hypothetical protein